MRSRAFVPLRTGYNPELTMTPYAITGVVVLQKELIGTGKSLPQWEVAATYVRNKFRYSCVYPVR